MHFRVILTSLVFTAVALCSPASASPDGTLHVRTAAAGTFTPASGTDDLVVENDRDGGITIVVPDANEGGLSFGNPTAGPIAATVRWKAADNLLTIGTNSISATVRFMSGLFSEAMTIAGSGNVGIGTPGPQYKLHVEGQVFCTNGCIPSSRAVKQNIRPLETEKALATVAGLEPIRFEYRHRPGDEHLGFIAEDVPDLLATQGRAGLDAIDIVAVLTKVVQEQQRQLERQEARIEELEARLRN